jgi:membrane associated rhomboid family serine protease
MRPVRFASMSEPDPTCYRHPGRTTLVRCSRCERPICTDCMRPAPVGIQCPECAGGGPKLVRPQLYAGTQPVATITLIVINVVVFLLERGGDSSTYVFRKGALTGIGVADGEWWRVGTAAFLHANALHILFNMYALWLLGRALERYIGTMRFLAIYIVSGITGSAGALLLTDAYTATVGASGAIFGLMGALFVLERRGMPLIGPILPVLLINLVFSLAYPGISIGGHIGGLIGGVLSALTLERFGRGHLAYGKLGVFAPAMLLAILVVDAGLIWYAVR